MAELIIVTAATGNIGNELTKLLLSKKKKVRAIARGAQKLKGLAALGAETVSASVDDAAAMKQAFAGASAAFILIPPNLAAPNLRGYQNKISETLAGAVRDAGVKKVVSLSSVGADLAEKVGPIVGLHDNEQRLNGLRVDAVHLRPGYFMENHFWGLPLIKSAGIFGSPIRPDVNLAMIATRDIAAVAAELLATPTFTGQSTRELLGPRDYTMGDAARIIGNAVGKPDLKYVQFPYADAEKAMTGMGMSADVARGFVEMYQGFNDGRIKPLQGRTPSTNTPTTLEDFSKVLAAAYKAG